MKPNQNNVLSAGEIANQKNLVQICFNPICQGKNFQVFFRKRELPLDHTLKTIVTHV